jgi:hypothetical protein
MTHAQNVLFSFGFSWNLNAEDGQTVKQPHADAITISDDDEVCKSGFMGYVPNGSMTAETRDKMATGGAQFFSAKHGEVNQFCLHANRWAIAKTKELRGEREEREAMLDRIIQEETADLPPEIRDLINIMFGRDDDGVFQGRQHMDTPRTQMSIVVTPEGVFHVSRSEFDSIVSRLRKQTFPTGG